jgi:VWFA-related protein
MQSDAGPTFRASSELVEVDVLVEQKKTSIPIRSLHREDFEIYEDGVRQQISQFSIDTAPISILFLFDMTDSVRPVLRPLAAGAVAVLGHLKPEDEVAVMLYAERADLTQDFTTDHELVAKAISAASAMHPGECGVKPELCSQQAFFNEGVFQAASHLAAGARPGNRRVVIWLTDNVPNIPDDKVHSEAATIDLLRESGVAVSALVERSGMSYTMMTVYTKNPLFQPFRKQHPPGDARKYALETGGEAIGANRAEISTKLADLIDRIRSRYTLGYRPAESKPKGTLSRIDVQVTRAALVREGPVTVRARRGYKW